MCVIIARDPGVTIPMDKFEIACDINKHGFGLSWVQKKKILTIRDLADNDAAAIYKELEKRKNTTVYLHLRHATVGAVNEKNSHPFFPLTKKEDGVDFAFMHNGTLSDFKPTGVIDSDSQQFSEKFLRPLLLRVLAFQGPTQLIRDEMLPSLLQSQIGYGESVFFMFDSNGRWLRVGREGKKFDGWWASNDYSFDINHVRSSKRAVREAYQHNNHGSGSHWNRYSNSTTGLPHSSFDDALPFTRWSPPKNDNHEILMADWEDELNKITREEALVNERLKHITDEITVIGNVIGTTKLGVDSMIDKDNNFIALDMKRDTFYKQAGLSGIGDVCRLSKENFAALCAEYPNAMAELFVDLAAEIHRHGLDQKTKKAVAGGEVTGTVL